MRPPGTPEQLEKRRRRAIAQVKAGHTLSTGARQLSASVSSVCRWWQVYQRDGHRGLRARPTPGRPSKLSDAQKRTLVRLLGQDPLRAERLPYLVIRAWLFVLRASLDRSISS